jgi:hypothetical protein
LASNQSAWASDERLAPLGHGVLVIESALDDTDPALLRAFVRELDDYRTDLESVR